MEISCVNITQQISLYNCQSWFGRGGGGSESGGSGCPGQLAGGAATLLRLEYSETDSSSDFESESSADQDPPASESETSQPADPGEKYCEMLRNIGKHFVKFIYQKKIQGRNVVRCCVILIKNL